MSALYAISSCTCEVHVLAVYKSGKVVIIYMLIIISQADLNVVGKNVSSNVSDHEGPSSVNNI